MTSELNKNPGNMTPEQLRDARLALEQGGSESTANAPAIYGSGSDGDKAKGLHHHTDYRQEGSKNFDQKIYMFPESFNALRRELHENWPTLWALVGYRMAFRADEFVELMNHACDVKLVLDSDNVDFICATYLRKLKQMRGLSGN